MGLAEIVLRVIPSLVDVSSFTTTGAETVEVVHGWTTIIVNERVLVVKAAYPEGRNGVALTCKVSEYGLEERTEGAVEAILSTAFVS